MKNSLKKNERLRKRSEFKNILDNGRIFKNGDIVSYFLFNKSERSRLGIIVRKKLGNAVKRNRIKRLFREAFRNNKWQADRSIDIVIIPLLNAKEITLLSANNFFKNLFYHIKK